MLLNILSIYSQNLILTRMKILLPLVTKNRTKSFLSHLTFRAQSFCLFAFILFTSGEFKAQTTDALSNKDEGAKLYDEELESKTLGTIILVNNFAEITDDLLELGTIWVVNPEYANIPFGEIKIKDGKTIINLSQSPNGKYFILGKKDDIIVGYRTVK